MEQAQIILHALEGKPSQDIQEVTCVGGMPTDTAVVRAAPDDGCQTISEDPCVAVNGEVENESLYQALTAGLEPFGLA